MAADAFPGIRIASFSNFGGKSAQFGTFLLIKRDENSPEKEMEVLRVVHLQWREISVHYKAPPVVKRAFFILCLAL